MSILTGYVPTPVGEAALTVAMAEAKLRDVPLIVLNATAAAGKADRYYADDATAAAVRARLVESGLNFHLLRSDSSREPADEIVDMAAELHADLVVIGFRQRTPIGKLLMGSTAQRVLLDSPCPVLAVKPQSPASADRRDGRTCPTRR